MAFNVRIFGHAGLVRMPVLHPHQFSSDSVFQLSMPYLWGATLVTNGATPVNSSPAAIPAGQTLDGTNVLRIEVPDGESIRYEVNNGTRTTQASVSSPKLVGAQQIRFGSGWTISIIDASAVAE